jgi:hypothetical protein
MSYTPEDFDTVIDADGNVIEIAEAPKTVPTDPDDLRAAVFAAFDTPDPSAALRATWNKVRDAGEHMVAVVVADENGVLVDGYAWFCRAVEAAKAGERLVDGGRRRCARTRSGRLPGHRGGRDRARPRARCGGT